MNQAPTEERKDQGGCCKKGLYIHYILLDQPPGVPNAEIGKVSRCMSCHQPSGRPKWYFRAPSDAQSAWDLVLSKGQQPFRLSLNDAGLAVAA